MKLAENQIKQKIVDIVKVYSEVFAPEYQAVVSYLKDKRKTINRHGEIKGQDVLQRIMFEIPATLHTIFETRLKPEEWAYYTSKEGTRWFQQTFKQFSSYE